MTFTEVVMLTKVGRMTVLSSVPYGAVVVVELEMGKRGSLVVVGAEVPVTRNDEVIEEFQP